ncbi:L-seryl-tRNA(Sec) selenium transferase [Desulfovibrio aminophilus]|uniref:L-seryl-tRNA(Sec) selenium transferase n=1 Tax=Desulfovibrio aminophilus TaxID=81425 RepID=UPI0033982392
MASLYRHLPSVDHCLAALTHDQDFAGLPRPLLKELVNRFLDLCREEIRSGALSEAKALKLDALLPRLEAYARSQSRSRFRRVLNATGVVAHTNLGRSLLAESAVQAVTEACRHYSNLEFDLDTGRRGSRYSHVEDMLRRLTGAEAALVVNNNAAAVLLVLETLAKGREVVVSRGQLVEIGGSFRIPEVMARSGAILREVGATNRTHQRDYEQAVGSQTAALMRVHTSNYRIQGFTSEVNREELRILADRYGLALIEDLGSGSLLDFSEFGLPGEPTVRAVVAAGVDVVTFSGDKVLGGPQAGVIVGRTEAVEAIKRNPLNRALRIDKMTLAALEATLRLYLDPELARREVPTLRMVATPPATLKTQAGRLARLLKTELSHRLKVSTRAGVSRVGGGAFPEQDLPTVLVALTPRDGLSVEALREALLHTDPPLVGRVEGDAFCLDPRTLETKEFALAARALAQALGA